MLDRVFNREHQMRAEPLAGLHLPLIEFLAVTLPATLITFRTGDAVVFDRVLGHSLRVTVIEVATKRA